MFKYQWYSTTIKTNIEANNMLALFDRQKPTIGAFDTETTGLHIVLDKPFIFQFGWLHPTEPKGYTYAVDLENQKILATCVIQEWHKRAKTLKIYLGHNVKFDMHMMTNIDQTYSEPNLSDTMFYIRFAHDALTPANGGPPMGLKDYTTKYIDFSAKTFEKELKAERSQMAKNMNLRLKQLLSTCGTPPAKYSAKSYTLSVIQDLFKDPTLDVSDLPDDIQDKYKYWHSTLPDALKPKVTSLVESDFIPYNWLNRDTLLKYAHKDVICTLEVYLKLAPIIKNRANEVGLKIENDLIIPLYEMERVGFATNKAYIVECQKKMKAYIKERRNTLYELAGQAVTVGQHALIKTIFNNEYNLTLESTANEALSKARQVHYNDQLIVQFIDVIQELRTLEKWYATYILRFLKDLTFTDRLYTTINQVGTVSGRVTSDFQQFPKDGINTIYNEELFHPRKMIKPSGENYPAIVYLDYSQIELRFQAFYTILVGNPDLNLCRAYMPYKCIDKDGVKFDYNNYEHIKRWSEPWFLEESPETPWTPTDVHTATTINATGLQPDHPDFKQLRSTIGKRVNFAKNYGAKINKIREMYPDKPDDVIQRIDQAYYNTFPGIKAYQDYCYSRIHHSYTSSLLGPKYYGSTPHKLINMLIQGSSAYFLKQKIKELYDYCKANGIKSRFQMNIHDELSWECCLEDDPKIFFKFKEIMEDWPDTLVPIVAEMEVTKGTWQSKKGVHNINELQIHLST